jgi:quercetin dioxygenase-like cupin family protein
MMKLQLICLAIVIFLNGCRLDDETETIIVTETVLVEVATSSVLGNGKRTLFEADIQFQEIAPFAQFGPVWGDRDSKAHGTAGIFPAEGRSPLHTHSAGYHGVVLSGLVTNPFGLESVPELLTPGSHWYVPAGEEHVTACEPEQECRFYFHSESHFDFSPIEGNMPTEPRSEEASTDLFEFYEFEEISSFAAFSTIWGDRNVGAHGTLGRFTPNSESPLHTHGETYYGVVIQGQMTNPFGDEESPVILAPGDYWYVPANSEHTTACVSEEECLFYFHSQGAFDFVVVSEE